MKIRAHNDGAALIVALAVFAILFSIAITFLMMTRMEMTSSVNVQNIGQAEMVANAGIAAAESVLNQDRIDHPNVTSPDHAWNSYFNGSWIAGKEWAFLLSGGAPTRWAFWNTVSGAWEGNPKAIPQIFFDGPLPATVPPAATRWSGPLLSTAANLSLLWDRSKLFIPREQIATDTIDALNFTANPFLLRTDPVITGKTSAEQVALWADVDNDEDGLKDAIWIPMASDQVLSGDGVDNDLDGIIDNKGEWKQTAAPETLGTPYYWGALDGFDNNGDGNIDEGVPEENWYTKAAPETGVFVYWGGDDGLDNNGDGLIDDATEQKYFLTVPLFGMQIRVVDKNGNPVDELGHLIDLRHPDGGGIFHCTVNHSVPPALPSYGAMRFITIDPNATITVSVPDDRNNPTGSHSNITLAAADVDTIDNDYSLLINDYDIIAREARDFTLNEPRRYHEIAQYLPTASFLVPALPALPPVITLCPPDSPPVDPTHPYVSTTLNNLKDDPSNNVDLSTIVSIQCTGEPVCSIVGRYAVTIRDEASKVNINEVGAFTYDDNPASHPNLDAAGIPDTTLPTPLLANNYPLLRSLNQGLGAQEYETSFLPYAVNNTFGSLQTARLANYRNGSADGTGLASEVMRQDGTAAEILNLPILGLIYPTPMTPLAAADIHGFLSFDANLPGYGRVDDNANALWMSMDGVDNDGDGLIDEGLNPGVDPGADPGGTGPAHRQWLIDSARYTRYQTLLNKTLEGIDEPQEAQDSSPLRNAIGASDAQDNNANGQTDEKDETGDKRFRTEEELKALPALGDAVLRNLKPFISVNSSAKNQAQVPYDPLQPATLSNLISKPKLDPNYATAAQLAEMLIGQGYRSDNLWGLPVGSAEELYARFLRSSEMYLVVPKNQAVLNAMLGSATDDKVLSSDDALHAMQMAVNIVDNRDADYERTTLTTQEIQNVVPSGQSTEWQENPPANVTPITYTVSGTEAIRITELMVRPARRFEAEADAAANLNPNAFSSDMASNPDFILSWGTGRSWRETIASHYPGTNFTIDPTNSWLIDPANECIGEVTGYKTSAAILPTIPVAPAPALGPIPNVIQFRFKPSPGLPPGRYYLTMNTSIRNAAGRLKPSVTGPILDPNPAIDPVQLRYTIKYVERDADMVGTFDQQSSILKDVEDAFWATQGNPAALNDYFASNWTLVDFNHRELIGLDAQGQLTGQIFLPDRTERLTVPPVTYPGYRLGNGTEDYACPVYVSSPSDPVQYDLLVAVTIDPGSSQELAVNYFEFSQEPDHEWVEVRNISDKAVDISGWDLTVGYDTLLDPNFRRLTVPANSLLVEPQKSVLLAVNRADNVPVIGGALFSQDGIALTGAATLPPTVAYDLANAPYGHPLLGGDVFTLNDTHIIGLESSDLAGDTTWQKVSKRILGGGVFPNYPEHDGFDNDGDNVVISGTDGSWTWGSGVNSTYFTLNTTLTLTNRDLVGKVIRLDDATPTQFTNGTIAGNSFVITSVDDSQKRVYLSVLPTGPVANVTSVPWVITGIDENRWWMDMRLDRQTFPLSGNFIGVPGGYDGLLIGEPQLDLMAPPTESPDWRTFVQRRSYPGDCVIVTLYEGAAEQNRVVDRVTYTEQDVVNRAIDDGIACPYTIGPLPGITAVLDGDAAINHPAFWPNNTMGADFYCSLERKHPLFTGDRFGTSNRWTATDGNYDDWAPRTNRFEVEYQWDNGTGMLTRVGYAARHTDVNYATKFNGTPRGIGVYEQMIDAPTSIEPIAAQTLTFADYQRQIQWAFQDSGWVRNKLYVSESDVLKTPLISYTQRLMPDTAQFAIPPNNRYVLPTDPTLVRADSSVVETLIGQPLRNIYSDIWNGVSITSTLAYPPLASLPEKDRRHKDLRAMTGQGVAMEPLELNCGQATFTAVWPYDSTLVPAPTIGDLNARMTWDKSSGQLPTAWMPVLLFTTKAADAPGFNYVVQDVSVTPFTLTPLSDTLLDASATPPRLPLFLLDGSQLLFPASISNKEAYLEGNPARWAPQAGALEGPQRRAMMYVAARYNGTPQTEALFEWRAETGLEPGTYDAYVITCQNPDSKGYFADPLGAKGFLSSDSRITDTGWGLMAQYRETCLTNNVKDMCLDIRFSTSEGDAAIPFVASPPTSAHPNSEGVIYYAAGPVTVTEDRYLALRLRNNEETPLARLNTFTKVVLTPRPRVAGKLNVNTVETRWVSDPGTPPIPRELFNPLMGVPGLLEYITVDSTPIPPLTPIRISHYPPAASDDLSLPEPPSTFLSMLNADYSFDNAAPPGPLLRTEALYDRARRILARRTEHEDARYYDVLGDLLVKKTNSDQTNGQGRYPLVPDYEYDNSPVPHPLPNYDIHDTEGPLFNDMLRRFARMQHLITTRSDTFEIIVTAQSGYGVDANGDGLINWRKDAKDTSGDAEFVSTAEKKIRTVYERPEPRQITQP